LIGFKKAVSGGALAFALLVCGHVAAQASPASESAAIHAVDDAWLRAYNAGEVEKVVALYDPNAVVHPPGAGTVRGKDAILAFFTKDMADFAKSGLILTLGPKPEGGAFGDTGWASGTWELKDKSGQTVDSGWYFSVSKKVGGKWLYVRDAWNSDQPGIPAPAGGNG